MGTCFAKLSGEVECGNDILTNRSESAPTSILGTIKRQKIFISSHLASHFGRLTHFSEDCWRREHKNKSSSNKGNEHCGVLTVCKALS